MVENDLERAAIFLDDPFEAALRREIEAVALRVGAMMNEPRAHHRHERQRHEGGDHDGHGERDRKFVKSRPTTSRMNSSGMSTAMSEIVSEMIVKPICPEPLSAASMGSMPAST